MAVAEGGVEFMWRLWKIVRELELLIQFWSRFFWGFTLFNCKLKGRKRLKDLKSLKVQRK